MEKTRCNRCGEFREFLNKSGICTFCIKELTNPEVDGTEIKISSNSNVYGKEIKSNNIKDHMWMGR